MTWAQGEFTGDGTVDINDLTIVLRTTTRAWRSAEPAAVPEPSSPAPLGVVAAGVLGYFWRCWWIGWRRAAREAGIAERSQTRRPAASWRRPA